MTSASLAAGDGTGTAVLDLTYPSAPFINKYSLIYWEPALPKVSKEHLENRRKQILEAAMTCFARKGFHETTMADIAAEAGVSDTLAYRYFRSKDEIIDAATAVWRNAPLLAFEGEDDIRTALELLMAQNRARFDDRQDMGAVMGMYLRTWAEAIHDTGMRRDVLDRWDHHLEVIEGLIRRAQAQGQVPAILDETVLARAMLATHYGLNVMAVLDEDVDIEACGEMMVALILRSASDHAAAVGGEAQVDEHSATHR